MKQMKSDLKAFEGVQTYFALGSIDLRKAKDQRPFLALTLIDKTGQISGYIWDAPEETSERLSGATYVHVMGKAKMHNGNLILSIEQIRRVGDEEVDINDFLEVVPGGVDLWMEKLFKHVWLIRDANCRAIINYLFSDPKFYEDFKVHPAGMTMHHNYVGGLVEHSVNTMSHAIHMADKYPGLLDRDILLTGALLHDIGKIREMTGGITRSYTTEGKLFGHIAIGYLMLDEKLRTMRGIPYELGLLLKHMILSHHGSLEFGSPVKPATAEAVALHDIENLDAKLNHLYSIVSSSAGPDDVWSSYDRFLGTEICRMKFRKELCVDTQTVGELIGAHGERS